MEGLVKGFADRTRLRILGLLLNGEVCVCVRHERLDIAQPKASRLLAYLRRKNERDRHPRTVRVPVPLQI
jgi:ArsR family transcriptional regulator, arsenate/arsenite/antimonite-responsive transcriptional repressor